jgi:hypothetical protein
MAVVSRGETRAMQKEFSIAGIDGDIATSIDRPVLICR